MKKLSILIFLALLSFMQGCKKEDENGVSFVIITKPPYNAYASGNTGYATLRGTIVASSNINIAGHGFQWKVGEDFTVNSGTILIDHRSFGPMPSPGNFEGPASFQGTTSQPVYCRAFAILVKNFPKDTVFGNPVMFPYP